MSLVGKVGRKRVRARFAMALLYILLIVGAVTTVYPFLFMATTGFKGPTDQNDNRLVPAYWTDETELVKKYVDDKYAGDLNMIASYTQGEKEVPSGQLKEYQASLEALPINQWRAGFRVPPNGVTSRLAVRWQAFLRAKYGSIDALNRAYVDLNQAFQQVPVPFEAWERKAWVKPTSQKFKDWLEFKVTLPAEFRIPIRTEWMWQEFLRTKFKNRFGDIPTNVKETAKSFSELRYFHTSQSDHGYGHVPRMDDLANEFERQLPAQFAPTLHNSDPSVEAALSGWKDRPFAAFDRHWAQTHSAELKSEFTSRNYGYAFDYMALHGVALWNTVVFCLLAIVTQLTVNPLAAYALSRFPMKATARILLFLLATMAFPAEVAMIPSFLLLKNLGMLNTFAALVLPSAASGYTIFLLKGFFDSLPQEVFDSGQVDGAPEWLMMLRLAFPLSKPVLGYIALLAFMGAYGSFIYAFLVCQDAKMWTLMVFVYQMQVTSPKAVVMAAVTLAALPTLIVFLACQRVIMRGIVLPGER